MQRSSPAPLDTTEAGFSLPFCSPHGTAWGNSVEAVRKEKKKNSKVTRKLEGEGERKT